MDAKDWDAERIFKNSVQPLEMRFKIPHEVIETGLSIIYQERKTLLKLSVIENSYAGLDDCGTETSGDV